MLQNDNKKYIKLTVKKIYAIILWIDDKTQIICYTEIVTNIMPTRED